MSPADDRLERLVTEMLDNAAPARPPASLVPDTERVVDETRRWPRAWATLREPPMRFGSGVVVGSVSARWVAVAAATLLLVLATVGAGIGASTLLAGPATIVVDQSGDGDTTSIGEAVAMAEADDRILVRPGTYVEAVVLDKDVDITGDGMRPEVVWSAPEQGPQNPSPTVGDRPYALLLQDVDAAVRNLTFSGVDSAVHMAGGRPHLDGLAFLGVGRPHTIELGRGQFPDAIAIYDHADATVSGSTFRGSGPIVTYENATATIEGNTLTSGSAIHVFTAGPGSVVRDNVISGSRMRAIGVYGGRPLVEGNIIADADADAIQVGIGEDATGSDATVQDNQISGAFTAISVAENAAPDIVRNDISDSELGIWVTRGADATRIADNTLADSDIGIRVLGGAGIVEGNTVTGGATGIQLVWEAAPSVSGNTVEGATTVGLSIDGGSSGSISGNHVCDNASNLDVEPEVEIEIRAANDICEDATD